MRYQHTSRYTHYLPKVNFVYPRQIVSLRPATETGPKQFLSKAFFTKPYIQLP